jgi:hypothetical protein
VNFPITSRQATFCVVFNHVTVSITANQVHIALTSNHGNMGITSGQVNVYMRVASALKPVIVTSPEAAPVQNQFKQHNVHGCFQWGRAV